VSPIVIYIGRKTDGCVYELGPEARARLTKMPGATPVRRVFIGLDTQADFELEHGGIEWQVAQLLTGLTRSQLEAQGGVQLYDPRTATTTTLDSAPR
jgi:hypothetical protein